MEKKPVRIALLLSLTLFGVLLFVASHDRGVDNSSYHAEVTYGVDVDLKWIAEADQVDHVVVQDTFNYYAGLIGQYAGSQSSRFRLDRFRDESMQAPSTDLYHWTGSLSFEAPDASLHLLNALVQQGYLEPGGYLAALGTSRGETALHLPIPGGHGQVLHIRQSAYELSLLPRVAELGAAEPEA